MTRSKLIIFMLSLTAMAVLADWRIETVDSGGAVGRFTSIAVDGFGNPHISYLDEDSKGLKYATRDFTGWQTETIDTPGTIENTTSITLDHRDIPHISFFEKTDRNLWYATRKNEEWITEVVDTEGWNGSGSDIKIDRFGQPHISYLMDHPVIHVKYARQVEAGWLVEKIGDEEIFGRATSLVLDNHETPSICYLFGWNLIISKKSAGQWEFETMFDAMQRGRSTSMAMDGAGQIHAGHTAISFGSTSQELNILYTWFHNAQWITEIIDTFPFSGDDLVGWEEHLVLDTAGTPHIVYYSIESKSLKYAKRETAGWIIETVDDSGDVGMFAAAAMDRSDNIHISYFDADNMNLKYATDAPESAPMLGIELSLPKLASPGFPFWVDSFLLNPGNPLPNTNVFAILEIGDAFWFWPGWMHFDVDTGTGLDYMSMDVATGMSRLEILSEFSWPDTGNMSVSGIRFTGALVSSDLTTIMGDISTVEWGYGPL